MKTITESQVQVNGASLQVELKNANSIATSLAAVACPVAAVSVDAPIFMTQLRGYAR
ncbi:MAG TPA: hypothetical protein VF532_11035 [Candidatus Angelobacter sp.]